MSVQSIPAPVAYKDIPGFPGYRVGDDGSVWSCREAIRGTRLSEGWHRLTPQPRRGYLRVGMWRGGKLHWRSVHRLVLESFVGPCPHGMECLHGPDPERHNNRLSNLRWGTPKENNLDKNAHGTMARGSRHVDAKLTEADIPEILAAVAGGESRRSVARRKRVSHTVINAVVNGNGWKHVAR